MSKTQQLFYTSTQKGEKMISTMNLNTPCMIQVYNKENACVGKFNMVLLETIDDVFSSLGSSCKQVIYFHLEKNFAIKKKEIPLKIEDFANALEQLFGDGARFIELRIIAALHKRTPNFTYTPASGDLVFADYLTSLRHFLINKKRGFPNS